MQFAEGIKDQVFRILGRGKLVVDLVPYINEYIKNNPDTEIQIGCDSQPIGGVINYAVVIVLYNQGKGGHVLYTKIHVKREKGKYKTQDFIKLWREVELSLALAEYLRMSGCKKVKYIDLDLNPDPMYYSNAVLRSSLGYVTSMGYEARCKPDAWSASYAADRLSRYI